MRIINVLLFALLLSMGLLGQQSGLEVSGEIKADSIDVNSGIIKNVADPISAQDAATKAYVDSRDTSNVNELQSLSEVLSRDSLANQRIKNVVDPVDAQDVVTKSYFEQILFDFALATMVDTSKTVQGLLDAGILPNTILNEGIDSIYFIGLNYAGGIIFYMESNGTGLVAAPEDQSMGATAPWGCYGTEITGADGVLIGSGNQNTIDIEADCATAGIAADICANLSLNGFTDWFLPSLDELNEMYTKIGQGAAAPNTNIGNFAADYYWSSTEVVNVNAWLQDFFFGNQLSVNKNFNVNVRAVRAF